MTNKHHSISRNNYQAHNDSHTQRQEYQRRHQDQTTQIVHRNHKHDRHNITYHGHEYPTTPPQQVYITMSSNDEPECASTLSSTGSEAIALWQNDVALWDIEVTRHQQAHPHYRPRLSKWVQPHIWKLISDEMLDPEDQTRNGIPNDEMTEQFLRETDKYTGRTRDVGKVLHTNALQEFQNIAWPTLDTNIAGYDNYMTQWNKIQQTMYTAQIPKEPQLIEILRAAIQPPLLKQRVLARMWSGLGPRHDSLTEKPWRIEARTNIKQLRRLIREDADHLDLTGNKPNRTPTQTQNNNRQYGKYTRVTPTHPHQHTNSTNSATPIAQLKNNTPTETNINPITPTTLDTSTTAPVTPDTSTTAPTQPDAATGNAPVRVCSAAECTTPVTRMYNGSWFKYCWSHKHLYEQEVNANKFNTPGASEINPGICTHENCNKPKFIKKRRDHHQLLHQRML